MTWETWDETWKSCVKCPIGTRAFKHVLGTGSHDAAVLFLGEGPGKSEDTLGQAFVGRAGALLKKAILDAYANLDKCYFSNLVACRPCDSATGPNRPPTNLEIGNCRDRLAELIRLLQPKGIVYVGQVARSYAKPTVDLSGWVGKELFIIHPAALLRRGGFKSSDYPKYVATIHSFMDNFKETRHGGSKASA